ncbi:MAG: molybdopterin-dependent oxidoreductase [Halomonas sp.]|nr:molybdopterin-dependent oxidoreductase [Halomonas sp.]MBR2514244.1 molybdopterin-dependent oxidoreductase [Halomonas sp.]
MAVKALLLGSIMLAFSIPQMGQAETQTALELPDGPVILKVKGDIARTNISTGTSDNGEEAHFDREMLQSLPQHAFETGTPWTEGVSHYSGPLMRTLLEHLGVEAESVHVLALNGYEADIPLSDFYDYDVILTLERDQKAIPIREYGPLWVLYPFDQDEELLSEKIRFRAVWQVMQINVH